MHVFKKSDTGFASVTVVFEGGSLLDPVGKRGLAHLIEHLMSHNTDGLHVKFFEGGISSNACTTAYSVEFMCHGIDEMLTPLVPRYVRSLLGKPSWDREYFENEKKVVIQELQEEVSNSPFGINVFRRHLGVCDPGGLLAELESITYEDTLEYYARNMRKPTRVVQLGSQKSALGAIKYAPSVPVPFTPASNLPLEAVPPRGGTATVMLVSKDCFPDEEYAKVAFIGGMLSHGLDAPLLSELRGKRGLVYFADFDLASYLHGGHLFLYGDTGSGAKALLLKKAFYKFLSDAPALSTRKRFISTKKWFVSKKKAMVLNGMYNKDLLYAGKMDPFLGVEDFTYQEILEAVKKWLNPESYVAYVEGITKW